MHRLFTHLPPPRHRLAVFGAGLVFALLVGWLDIVTGSEVNLGFFYFVSIALVGWSMGIADMLVFVVLCVIIRWGVDWTMGDLEQTRLVLAWNTVMRGALFGFVGIAFNRLRAAIEREKVARAAAQRAADNMANFLANVSHEIRTPLNALIGMGDLLAETPLNADQRQYVELCRREGEYLRHLVNDLLELSRLDAGHVHFEEADFDLREFATGVLAGLAPRAREKHLALKLELAPALGRCWRGDTFRLRQVLVNLLGNAIKFTAGGEVRLRIEPAPAGQRGLTFRVSDTGAGIAAERRARIFERYVQGDSGTAREFGGAGLGLSICQGLVLAMGGRIWCESEPGRGSEFGFTVPLGAGDPAAAPRSAAAPAAAAGALRPPLIRALLAEDSAVNRLVIARLLPPAEFALRAVEHGRRALEEYQAGDYQLVILDVNMPEMDGLAAARAIRAWERETGRAPACVLALSASAFAEDRERARAAGCSGFVAKPVRKEELLAAIRRVLPAPAAFPAAGLAPAAELAAAGKS